MTSPWDNIGRIHKQAFLVSNIVLFAICIVSVCSRYYIRIKIQREFSIDDGILLFGVLCLITAMGLLPTFLDEQYIVTGALEYGDPNGAPLPDNFIEQAFRSQKFNVLAMVLTWTSIVCVKFSYLFLFKRLITRLPYMVGYWWFAAGYNALISIYGATVYGVACPHFYSLKALSCLSGAGLKRTISLGLSQMVLDIFGDLLIIFIPCRLIWSIKIRWTQKLAIACSLCLTILTIVCTILRIAGIRTHGSTSSIDSMWETFWQYIAANISLTMTAATAFRQFFISRTSNRHHFWQETFTNSSWSSKSMSWFRSVFVHPIWRSRMGRSRDVNPEDSDPISSGEQGGEFGGVAWELRQPIPRGVMTGVMSYIESDHESKPSGVMITETVAVVRTDDDSISSAERKPLPPTPT